VKVKVASPNRAESKDQYHHGDLKNALIEAAEGLLEEKGAKEFSLRECARRVGVTPTAVAHHFGNASGLVTAVAAVSFAEFAKLLATESCSVTASGIGRTLTIMRHG
jgi:AcrR family transcriptional regulator